MGPKGAPFDTFPGVDGTRVRATTTCNTDSACLYSQIQSLTHSNICNFAMLEVPGCLPMLEMQNNSMIQLYYMNPAEPSMLTSRPLLAPHRTLNIHSPPTPQMTSAMTELQLRTESHRTATTKPEASHLTDETKGEKNSDSETQQPMSTYSALSQQAG